MPIAGLGLHVVVALICAIHAVKTRQNNYWLFILFAFPLLGSIVYFFAVYLPNSRLERGAMKAVAAAARAVDPGRAVREARQAFDDTPTAQNQMRLAAALMEVGDASAAAVCYEACMAGPFANDLELRLGAARAYTECQRYQEALKYLGGIRREKPDFRAEAVSLLTARCLAGTDHQPAARAEFQDAESRFGTYEAKAEFAIWALAIGDSATALRLGSEMEKISSRWNPLTRELNEGVQRKYLAAKKLAGAA